MAQSEFFLGGGDSHHATLLEIRQNFSYREGEGEAPPPIAPLTSNVHLFILGRILFTIVLWSSAPEVINLTYKHTHKQIKVMMAFQYICTVYRYVHPGMLVQNCRKSS